MLTNIALVGSVDYQRKWCVQGTSLEYVLLDELIDTTIYAVKHRSTHPVLSKNLSAREKAILLDFHDTVEALFGDIPWRNSAVSIEEIVEYNAAMKSIRQAANNCLRMLGVEFSAEELSAE